VSNQATPEFVAAVQALAVSMNELAAAMRSLRDAVTANSALLNEAMSEGNGLLSSDPN
jgi:hypothetical protein